MSHAHALQGLDLVSRCVPGVPASHTHKVLYTASACALSSLLTQSPSPHHPQSGDTPLAGALKSLAREANLKSGSTPKGGAVALLLEAQADHKAVPVRLVSVGCLSMNASHYSRHQDRSVLVYIRVVPITVHLMFCCV